MLNITVLPAIPHGIRPINLRHIVGTPAEEGHDRHWPEHVAEVRQVFLRRAVLVRQAQHLAMLCFDIHVETMHAACMG